MFHERLPAIFLLIEALQRAQPAHCLPFKSLSTLLQWWQILFYKVVKMHKMREDFKARQSWVSKSESKALGVYKCVAFRGWGSPGRVLCEWEKCLNLCAKDGWVWGCFKWENVSYGRLARLVYWVMDWATQVLEMFVCQFFLGISLLAPLLLASANLILGELALPMQGHQNGDKTEAEIQSRVETFPEVGAVLQWCKL